MIYLLILLSGASFPPSGDVWKPVSGSWNTPVLQADNATWEHSAVQEVSCVRSINSHCPLSLRSLGILLSLHVHNWPLVY